ncbi:MAG: sensor diguanylate cyclase, partial [Frankiales bacterium]|nr:sensor diguanylate cyclase [Frankiales bacterium]
WRPAPFTRTGDGTRRHLADTPDMRRHELHRLAELAAARPGSGVTAILHLICELLDMDLAYAATVEEGCRTVRASVLRDASGTPFPLGEPQPLAQSWCAEVLRRGGLLAADIRDDPDLRARAGSQDGGGSFAGAVLRDAQGTAQGVVGAISTTPHPSLNERDLAVLEVLGEVLLPLLQASEPKEEVTVPAAFDLAAIAGVVASADNLEQLTRPLLDALHALSGIATTYLTTVRMDEGFQEIRYVANQEPAAPFAMTEGTLVPWDMTLCKRALEDGVPFASDADERWGDNIAVQMLGLHTFMSVPVQLSDGRTWGTLCASDDRRHEDAGQHVPTLRLFAKLIAAEIDRNSALERAELEARTDQLTGCSTRRVVEPWISTALAACRDDDVVALLFVDVDRFKSVNDTFGHAAGDEILAQIGDHLRRTSRAGDLVARLGGDEFLVGARLPRATVVSLATRVRLAAVGSVQDHVVHCSVGIATSDDVAVPGELLALADARMYAEKGADRS